MPSTLVAKEVVVRKAVEDGCYVKCLVLGN